MTADADTVRNTTARQRSFRLSRKMRRPPLLAHLVGFALIVLIPALLFSAFLILQFSRQQEEIAAGQVSDTAEIISNSIDREIFGLMTAAKVLASSPFIDRDDLMAFHERTIAALFSSNSSATLIDPQMRVVLNTRLPYPGTFGQAEYTETVERTFRTRQTQVSGTYYSDNAENFVFHVAVPVIRGNSVIYVLTINKATERLETVIADKNLPRAWSAIVKDGGGHRVIEATAAGGELRSVRTDSQDNPSIAETFGSGLSDDLIEASHVSPLSGWTTTVAVPNAVIAQPIMRSWMLLVAGGTALLLFCFGLAYYLGQKIATPILHLKEQAVLIGKGEPASPISTDIEEIGEVSKVLAHASRDRREAETQNRFLMREMTHRAKNQYALIAAIARRAAKESANTTEFLATLSEALDSLARSADLLAGRGWDSASLQDLVQAQLKAFGAGNSDQILISGPAVRLSPAATQTIGLALHELATNAAKYGSLSADDGKVQIDWALEDDFRMSWHETDGPPVTEPKRSGFGTLVTQKMTARGLGGNVEMTYAPTGVVWKLVAPADSVVAN